MNVDSLTRRDLIKAVSALGAAAVVGLPAGAQTPPDEKEIEGIAAALGRKGSLVADQAVYTVPLPRNDLTVRIQGEPVPVPLGFGGWVSFKKTRSGRETVMMSDAVLLQEEVNPVISAAQAQGLEVSALHNHFFYEEPRIFYMHLHGKGTGPDLARRYAAAVAPSKLLPSPPVPAADGPKAAELFDLAALDKIVGAKGVANGPAYKFTLGRKDLRVMAMDAELTAAIGLNSWAAFAGQREKAVIAGDVAMLEQEVNPVIRTLRQNGLEIVAVHNHMLGEQPRVLFLHYFGRGPAAELARGFRAALDVLGKPQPGAGH